MHNPYGDGGKAEEPLSPEVQDYGDFSPSLPSSQQLWEVAEGLWWLVAWCGPSVRNNVKGASDLLEESSSILEGPGPRSTGLLTMPTIGTGHESTAAGKH